jgi:hypothetical protein
VFPYSREICGSLIGATSAIQVNTQKIRQTNLLPNFFKNIHLFCIEESTFYVVVLDIFNFDLACSC